MMKNGEGLENGLTKRSIAMPGIGDRFAAGP
jgi:hypothetical protein